MLRLRRWTLDCAGSSCHAPVSEPSASLARSLGSVIRTDIAISTSATIWFVYPNDFAVRTVELVDGGVKRRSPVTPHTPPSERVTGGASMN
jgi:hypothetical protein